MQNFLIFCDASASVFKPIDVCHMKSYKYFHDKTLYYNNCSDVKLYLVSLGLPLLMSKGSLVRDMGLQDSQRTGNINTGSCFHCEMHPLYLHDLFLKSPLNAALLQMNYPCSKIALSKTTEKFRERDEIEEVKERESRVKVFSPPAVEIWAGISQGLVSFPSPYLCSVQENTAAHSLILTHCCVELYKTAGF